MKYTKNIEHKVNVRPYETITIGASIDWDDDDASWEELDDIDIILDSLIARDLHRAKDIANSDSYLHDWLEDEVVA